MTTQSEVRIRPATKADLPNIVALNRNSRKDRYPYSWFAQRAEGGNSKAFVATLQDEIIGLLYYRLRPEGPLIECLNVQFGNRTGSVAIKLMEKLFDLAPLCPEQTVQRLISPYDSLRTKCGEEVPEELSGGLSQPSLYLGVQVAES